MALFNQFVTAVVSSSHLSEYLQLTRGCHQGSPISPYIYLICGEIMAYLPRQNKKIKGIPVLDIVNLISQFADDTDLFLIYDFLSLNEVVDTLTIIERNTGLLLNYDKTSIYRIGSLRNSRAKLYTKVEFKWTNEPITVLGVKMSNNTKSYLMRIT